MAGLYRSGELPYQNTLTSTCYILKIYQLAMVQLFALILIFMTTSTALAQDAPIEHISSFEAGTGPTHKDGVYSLLNRNDSFGQSNAVAFDLAQEGFFYQVRLRCRLRVLSGGDGGSFIFLNTAEYGKRGPAPFVKSWVEPNLAKTFAVAIDVHNPPSKEPFGPWGNYQGFPEREVSLHWDGREIVKRVSPAEFRGDFTDCEISLRYVTGGAEVTVRLAGEMIYDNYFIAGVVPYEARLAIGAGTRDDTATEFDVKDIAFTMSEPALPGRAPKHFEVFNHVRTDSTAVSHEQEVILPPLDWAYERVVLTLDIHDAGPNWNTWDQIGHLYIIGADGVEHDIAPFITSYRTPCHWKVDITHFRPWLNGKVSFKLIAGISFDKERGYMMSASLDFYHGTPNLEPYRITPLWVGTAQYKSADNHFSDFFNPQTVEIGLSAKAARLYITTTGHTKIGEFTPSRRTVVFSPEKDGDAITEQRFENTLWKDDNYLNPVRPQRGTWKYARAGWAPGDIVRPWWIDLTPFMVPGKTAELRYEPQAYDFSGIPTKELPSVDQINQAIQIVRAYLILYRPPVHQLPAPVLQVLDVEKDSNASKSGIQEGDYIESYDGKSPDSIDALRAAIKDSETSGKERIIIKIYRDTERLVKKLAPGRMGVTLVEQ